MTYKPLEQTRVLILPDATTMFPDENVSVFFWNDGMASIISPDEGDTAQRAGVLSPASLRALRDAIDAHLAERERE